MIRKYTRHILKFFLLDYRLYSFLTSLWVIIPTVYNLPYEYCLISFFCMLFGFLVKKRFRTIMAAIGALLALYFVVKQFGTILDIEAGLSLIVVLQSLKFLEMKNKKGFFVHYMILLLIITGQILFVQNLLNTFFALSSLLLVIYGLIKNEDSEIKVTSLLSGNLKRSFYMLAVALPIAVSMYFFFPRLVIGFTKFNQGLTNSGFSDDLMPGMQNSVALSNKPAFRVTFNNRKDIPTSILYWVGSVIYQTDGYRWKDSLYNKNRYSRESIVTKVPPVEYTITSELMSNSYLFTLDTVYGKPDSSYLYNVARPKTFKLIKVQTKKIQYTAKSILSEIKTNKLNKFDLTRALQVPKKVRSGRLADLANLLTKETTLKTLNSIFLYFKKRNFKYTLNPGMTSSLEEFVFETKKGFCSHYASAFAILARLAGIPARVVVGYQGARKNPIGDFYTVSEKDAHAWTEAFIDGRGWVRFDPVALIQPQRIELGGSDFFELLPTGEGTIDKDTIASLRNNWFKTAGLYWENVNNSWGQYMYSFDENFQKKLASSLKISMKSFYSLAIYLPLSLLFIYGLSVLYFKSKSNILTKEEIRYRKVIKELARHGVIKGPQDGPLTLLKKISSLKDYKPKKYDRWSHVITEYHRQKYKGFS